MSVYHLVQVSVFVVALCGCYALVVGLLVGLTRLEQTLPYRPAAPLDSGMRGIDEVGQPSASDPTPPVSPATSLPGLTPQRV